MTTTKFKLTLTEEMLGSACGNPDVHKEFIASKSADAAKLEEEMASLPAADLENKAKTVFHRGSDGKPILYNYMIKGLIKEVVGILLDTPEWSKEIKIGKTKLSKYTYKRVVDNFVFVTPRKIQLSNPTGADCTRPLRADTMKGERVSLATSETVPAGTTFEFGVATLGGGADFDALIRACFDYGALKGLGVWRNSGKGTFSYEVEEDGKFVAP